MTDQVKTIFLVNPVILQNIANYLVERPFKETAGLIEQIQSCQAVQGEYADTVEAALKAQADSQVKQSQKGGPATKEKSK